MSMLVTNALTRISDFFVPRDADRRSAELLIDVYDDNHDGRIDVTALREDRHFVLPGFVGSGHLLFGFADRAGNDNGFASLREVRSAIRDTRAGVACLK